MEEKVKGKWRRRKREKGRRAACDRGEHKNFCHAMESDGVLGTSVSSMHYSVPAS